MKSMEACDARHMSIILNNLQKLKANDEAPKSVDLLYKKRHSMMNLFITVLDKTSIHKLECELGFQLFDVLSNELMMENTSIESGLASGLSLTCHGYQRFNDYRYKLFEALQKLLDKIDFDQIRPRLKLEDHVIVGHLMRSAMREDEHVSRLHLAMMEMIYCRIGEVVKISMFKSISEQLEKYVNGEREVYGINELLLMIDFIIKMEDPLATVLYAFNDSYSNVLQLFKVGTMSPHYHKGLIQVIRTVIQIDPEYIDETLKQLLENWPEDHRAVELIFFDVVKVLIEFIHIDVLWYYVTDLFLVFKRALGSLDTEKIRFTLFLFLSKVTRNKLFLHVEHRMPDFVQLLQSTLELGSTDAVIEYSVRKILKHYRLFMERKDEVLDDYAWTIM